MPDSYQLEVRLIAKGIQNWYTTPKKVARLATGTHWRIIQPTIGPSNAEASTDRFIGPNQAINRLLGLHNQADAETTQIDQLIASGAFLSNLTHPSPFDTNQSASTRIANH